MPRVSSRRNYQRLDDHGRAIVATEDTEVTEKNEISDQEGLAVLCELGDLCGKKPRLSSWSSLVAPRDTITGERPFMKVGVISDTHVPGAAPSLPPAVFEIFKGVDLILHAGDIVSYTVLDELAALAPVEAVAGNMDDNELHLRLPAKKVLKLGRFTVGLTHGKYRIDVQKEMVRKDFGSVDLIVLGHSHMPFWGEIDGV